MTKTTKNTAGGAAMGGGMNFQAAVTAIASVHIAGSTPLKWLVGLINDTPIKIEAETGGAGDDINLVFSNDQVAEVQVKKGFRKGADLWNVLTKLAIAINAKDIDYGILVVCPDSSSNVAKHLANDIRRIGEGRSDNLKPISKEFIGKLKELGLPYKKICSKLRIITVHALKKDQATIVAAEAILANICTSKNQVTHAWNQLYLDACEIVENRGAQSVENILQSLNSISINIGLENSHSALQVLGKLTKSVLQANSTYSIWGLQKPLSIENDWINVPIYVQKAEGGNASNLFDALTQYHNLSQRGISRDAQNIGPLTLGRFFKHIVIKAGPGMGKTTLLKRLAYHYAQEGFPVIKVSLRNVSQRMNSKGETFEESLLSIGLANHGITPEELKAANFQNVVYLLDALDECGQERSNIAENISSFGKLYTDARILVTSRTIGYEIKYLPEWRHYEIMPLSEDSVSRTLSEFLEKHLGGDDPRTKVANDYAQSYSDKNPVKKFIARSPLLLSLVASLSINGITFHQSRSTLYSQIFKLFDDEPNARLSSTQVNITLMHRVLDILAFELISEPTCNFNVLKNKCAHPVQVDYGINTFAARQEIELAINYWQEIGVLERVVFSNEETITFIHLTFAEYAAARYLSSLAEPELEALLPSIIDSVSFSEVIRFASEMDNAETLYNYFTHPKSSNEESLSALKTCLNIAINSEKALPEHLIENLTENTINYILNSPKYYALKIADLLTQLVARFPSLAASKLIPLKTHENNWTRLISYTCLIQCGLEYIDIIELENALITLPNSINPRANKFSSGFIFSSVGQDVVNEFICRSTFLILSNCSESEALRILKKAYATAEHWSIGTHGKLDDIFGKENKQHVKQQAMPKKVSKSIMEGFDFAKMQKDHNAVNKAIFSILSTQQQSKNIVKTKLLYHLSSFLETSQFWESAPSDVRELRDKDTHDVIEETFNAFIQISGLSSINIAKEAKSYLELLETYDGDRLLPFFDLMPHVDVPNVIQGMDKEDICLHKIIAACSHPSTWVLQMAFHVLANTLSEEALIDTFADLIMVNNRYTLQLISIALTNTSSSQKAIDLYNKRLKVSLYEGCQYFYKHMTQLSLEYDNSVQELIDIGLSSKNPRIVNSATIFAKQYFDQSPEKSLSSFRHTFDYWLKNEKPYPKKGGAVPESPRDELLTGIFKLAPPNYEDLKPYLIDDRPDVKSVAQAELTKVLKESEGFRSQFIKDIISTKIDIHLLETVLTDKNLFTKPEILDLCSLLNSDNAKARYVAMKILDLKYLGKAEIEKFALKLLKDDEIDIREQAESILHNLSP